MATTFDVPDDLSEAVSDAVETLTKQTGLDADALFGERVVDSLAVLAGPSAYAAGFLEGAALACNLTVLEFLDLVRET